MNITENKIVLLCHGRAGFECFKILLKCINDPKSHLFVVTYDDIVNQDLIQMINLEGIKYITKRIKDEKLIAQLKTWEPDLIVSMHYRHLIPEDLIQHATYGGINLHPSLLPKYRGAFSAPWVIINQEKYTGITYHFMNDKFDDGYILLQKKIHISKTDTAFSLFNRLIDLGVDNFEEALKLVLVDHSQGYKQKGKSTYFPRKIPYEGLINPLWNEEKIDAFIRAMYFPPHLGAQIKKNEKLHEVTSLDEYYSIIDR